MLVIANVPNVEHVQREVYRLHDEDDAFRAARSGALRGPVPCRSNCPEPLADQGGGVARRVRQSRRGNTGGAASGGTNRGGAASGGTNPGGAAATLWCSGPQA